MTVFTYQAGRSGKTISGEIEASDKRMAAIFVRKKGLVPLAIEEKQSPLIKPSAKKKSISFGSSTKIKSKDITFMTRQLATLLSSGLPLSKALNFLAGQVVNPALEKIVVSIEDKLQGGATLSEALTEHPKLFDSLYLSMIRSGEAGGILDKILERLAFMGESREELAGKVKGALVYPAFMFLAMTGCIMVLMTVVVPRFALMFADMGQMLPLPTLILMNMADLIKAVWWLAPIVVVAAISGFKTFTASAEGALRVDLFKLKLPKIGTFLLTVSMTRFCRTVGTLLQSGVPLLSVLQSAIGVAGNAAVQKGIEQITRDVREGKKLGESMAAAGIFPRYVCEMATMGEESGRLDNMMIKVAENYEREVEQLVKALTSLLEPLMILVMGGVVAFIVMAMLFPIFQMNLMAG